MTGASALREVPITDEVLAELAGGLARELRLEVDRAGDLEPGEVIPAVVRVN